MLKTILILFITIIIIESYKITWDNDVDIDLNEINEDNDGKMGERKIPNWFFIYPGTKWCGTGNIAENYSDLGTFRETDKCCRQHDSCPDLIEGYQTKYELKNPSFYARLHCDCDEEFYLCLKSSANKKTSKQVGHLYFTALNTECFKEEYPIAGCNRYTTFPRKKCLEYILNTGLSKKYQWFDLRNF